MARFDLFRSRSGAVGYLLDVQANALERLETRVLIPLTPLGRSTIPARQLNPQFDIEGEPHILQTQWLASVGRNRLGRRVGTLGEYWDEITRALDMLLTGF